ncbi:unnamed protein product [Camellia sinensis]
MGKVYISIRRNKRDSRYRSRLVELDKVKSMMPIAGDPERYSFWLATLTNRRPSERLELLSTNTRAPPAATTTSHCPSDDVSHTSTNRFISSLAFDSYSEPWINSVSALD